MFNEFLDETTPVPTMINVDDVKTVDLAGFDKEEDDFPIYDTEIVPQPTSSPVSTPVLKNSEFPGLKDAMMSTGLTDADFADMPIFSNFPMMGPGEFIPVEYADDIFMLRIVVLMRKIMTMLLLMMWLKVVTLFIQVEEDNEDDPSDYGQEEQVALNRL